MATIRKQWVPKGVKLPMILPYTSKGRRLLSSLINKTSQGFTQFRHSLAGFDALPQLTFLGVIIGCLCGLLIVLFRLAIEWPLALFLPQGHESFETLPVIATFLLPVIGAFIIGLCLHFTSPKYRAVSVGYVLERVHNFQGRLSFGNWLVQFFGGILCLLTGQSVGREGPAVLIGAGAASLTGQWLRLPNNSLSTLVGCGVAAAISASFNTPIAGVIFAMEVVLMRYTITGFIPVMMASVCGSLVARATLGEDLFFTIDNAEISLREIPFLLIAGLIIGTFAAFYMMMHLRFSQFNQRPVFARIMIAGVITGTLAILFPEILGLGYDTINLALEGQLAINLLLGIAIAKIVATSISVGLGMPGGLIGPQLLIGACIGGLIGTIGTLFFPNTIDNHAIYVLLGMAAMMGSVINAPLAALTAVVELTYSPSIIFPSMMIIVISCLTTRVLLKREGIFVAQLKQQGTALNNGPLQQVLGTVGVRNAMNTAFVQTGTKVSANKASKLLERKPVWLVIDNDEDDLDPILLRASDLALALSSLEQQTQEQDLPDTANKDEPTIDLLEIPGQRFDLIRIHELASLLEAKQSIDGVNAEALMVVPQIQTSSKTKILGIITRDTVNNYYN